MTTIPSIFVIIMLVCIPILAVVTSVVLLCTYQSPMDTFGAALFPKIISVIVMSITFLIPMTLPFDVANVNSGGGLNGVLPYIWQGSFVAIALVITLIIPFVIMFYESGGTDIPIWRQFLCAGISTALIFIIFGGITFGTFWFLGTAQVDIIDVSTTDFSSALSTATAGCTTCTQTGTVLNVSMSFVVYLIAALSVVGWAVFLVLGGIGVSAFPMGFIRTAVLGFMKREALTEEQYRKIQKEIAQETGELIKVGMKVNDLFKGGFVASIPNRKAVRDFQDAVKQVEDDFKLAKKNFEDGGGSIFIPIGSLITGILISIISIAWVVHIILYMTLPTPIYGFLNNLLIFADSLFNGLSWIIYCVFAYYLIVCVVSGNALIARNIPIFSVYPLKWRDTLANGFLVNTGIMLVSSIGALQFLSTAFADWATLSTIDVMFSVMVKNMIYVKFAFQYIHYVFFGFVAIGLVLSILDILWNALRPKKRTDGLKKFFA